MKAALIGIGGGLLITVLIMAVIAVSFEVFGGGSGKTVNSHLGKYALRIDDESCDVGRDRLAALRPQSVGACNVR